MLETLERERGKECLLYRYCGRSGLSLWNGILVCFAFETHQTLNEAPKRWMCRWAGSLLIVTKFCGIKMTKENLLLIPMLTIPPQDQKVSVRESIL